MLRQFSRRWDVLRPPLLHHSTSSTHVSGRGRCGASHWAQSVGVCPGRDVVVNSESSSRERERERERESNTMTSLTNSLSSLALLIIAISANTVYPYCTWVGSNPSWSGPPKVEQVRGVRCEVWGLRCETMREMGNNIPAADNGGGNNISWHFLKEGWDRERGSVVIFSLTSCHPTISNLHTK